MGVRQKEETSNEKEKWSNCSVMQTIFWPFPETYSLPQLQGIFLLSLPKNNEIDTLIRNLLGFTLEVKLVLSKHLTQVHLARQQDTAVGL